ncbi:hybrid sensor histidine kinase/response regulator [Roseateles depolymerans]|uniref:histidine kinase n=1 Tax=Roseateles depolymerans TaxID=76731 RepID=A0A0U3NCI1_9BURK|nr:histidine kinase [Roseateles depolymerans]ALV06192.1 Response regulator receiver sensor signal transduction histidine kinase [Roseateles depolymerans]REG19160.1 histidine kinase/DNA gyrase B/HSP90-like ATPase [Roseateles depolymerans]
MPALPQGERRLRLLHIEDSDLDHQLILAQLQRAGLSFEISRLDSLPAVEAALSQSWDAIISDYNLPGFSGLVVLDLIKQRQLIMPFILVSGEIGEDTAVAAMRNGASDYLLKNNLARLAPALLHAIESCEAQRARHESDRELIKSKQQLHELAGHLQTSVEMERAAIAREIHDDVGGSLTAIKFDLAWIARHTNDAAVQQRVQSALETVSSAIESSQRIMHNLRPAILEQGLLAAVQWLAARFERRTGIPTAVRSGEDRTPLPAGVPLVAYRTAQEALTNVSKHANATRVDVELSMDGGVLTLEVKDNGQGLAPGDLSKARSFGIRGLRERAATVGGWVDMSSGVHGTSLILTVPLRGVIHPFEDDFADEDGHGASGAGSQSEHDPSAWGQL